MIIEDAIITVPDCNRTIDIHPRGGGCDALSDYHEFFLDLQAAGFIYRICGRCGTVRIGERR